MFMDMMAGSSLHDSARAYSFRRIRFSYSIPGECNIFNAFMRASFGAQPENAANIKFT